MSEIANISVCRTEIEARTTMDEISSRRASWERHRLTLGELQDKGEISVIIEYEHSKSETQH